MRQVTKSFIIIMILFSILSCGDSKKNGKDNLKHIISDTKIIDSTLFATMNDSNYVFEMLIQDDKKDSVMLSFYCYDIQNDRLAISIEDKRNFIKVKRNFDTLSFSLFSGHSDTAHIKYFLKYVNQDRIRLKTLDPAATWYYLPMELVLYKDTVSLH